ncbi:nitroreductase [Variovorax sp. dw_954]|uniref:nitroreductase family protein n=1 Tax=Variovorax sp. dw_954 TaxID=2720078 RepID=UPI0021166859|nr:nitroreductase [Variovorax sp. dw_954]
MPAAPPQSTGHRHPFSSLGRHLHRSVLRTCLPADALRAAMRHGGLPSGGSDALLVEAAVRIVAEDAREAEALHRALDEMHHEAIRRFESARNEIALLALWTAAAGTPDMPGAYWAVLTHPAAGRLARHHAFGDVEMLATPQPTGPLPMLLGRRSVSPRRLMEPGPEADQLDLMLQAALSAPDHGRLHPWRVIEFRSDAREGLADLFEDEKRRRDPIASAHDIRRARGHATEPPCLLAFVVSLRQRKKVPLREQWIAAGAALGSLMNAAHELGFGAIVLSGDRCFDPHIAAELGLVEGETLAGFISIGTIADPPPEAARPLSQTVWSCWSPQVALLRTAQRPRMAWNISDSEP